MNLEPLTAVSPIDGRYRTRASDLAPYFSEYALVRYRVLVEVEYLIALLTKGIPSVPRASDEDVAALRAVVSSFGVEDARRVKEIEARTNHDVKAVEYFLRERLEASGLARLREYVHFGLTSQDVNDCAIPLSIKDALNDVYVPMLERVLSILDARAEAFSGIVMLARTHGQPASPTSLGKELAVFAERLRGELRSLASFELTGKLSGATGNFNAHCAAFPGVDWLGFADDLLARSLGLRRSHPTTQINHYENLAELFDRLRRIHTVLVDLAQDVWIYAMLGYLRFEVVDHEVGSSAMPHKVNPIEFENAEGNLGLANAILVHLASTLPISRLQRDLRDYTLKRNIGVAFAHGLVAVGGLAQGLEKAVPDRDAIRVDLDAHGEVVAEGIQAILRREGYEHPYETMRVATRGKKLDTAALARIVDSLEVTDVVRDELRALTPHTYCGVATRCERPLGGRSD